MNWVVIFNRLFEIINTEGDTYYSGPKFLDTVREINYGVPSYQTYIDQRKEERKSTSRRDYYFDLFMEQPENDRKQIVTAILDTIGGLEPVKSEAIRQLLC